MKAASGSSLQRRDTDIFLLIAFGALKLVFHLLVNTRYGFHRDELATLADARHLDWGYVAYPPLTPLLGRIELILFGTSLTGFRFFAALAQSIAIVVTGLMTRELGGKRSGMFIAAGATAIAPISIGASSLFQYVSFDYLWFVLLAYFIVRLIRSDDRRWWVAIGVVIGLAIETSSFARWRVFTQFCLHPNARVLAFTAQTMVKRARLIFTVLPMDFRPRSAVNSYWARGPGTPPPESLIVLGGKRERLETLFASVELVGHTPNPWQIENEETRDNPDIFFCRGLHRKWSELWPLLRSFG